MAEEPTVPVVDGRNATDVGANSRGQGRSRDEVALDLMKFIAVTTGYGKGSGSAAGAGFSGKPINKSADEYADALFQLFERCRVLLAKDPAK
jgi:hypothetical protein